MCTIEENCSRDLLGTTRLITEFDSRYVIYPLTEETHEIKRLKRQETQYTTSVLYSNKKYSPRQNA